MLIDGKSSGREELKDMISRQKTTTRGIQFNIRGPGVCSPSDLTNFEINLEIFVPIACKHILIMSLLSLYPNLMPVTLQSSKQP